MGREYPGGPEKFRQRCYNAFKRQSTETDPEKIEKAIGLGEYVVKEIEALYSLRKYRAMKRRYYDEKWGQTVHHTLGDGAAVADGAAVDNKLRDYWYDLRMAGSEDWAATVFAKVEAWP